jgi:hypothetical protein
MSFRCGRDGPLGRFRISSVPKGDTLQVAVIPQPPPGIARPAPSAGLVSNTRSRMRSDIPFDVEWLPTTRPRPGRGRRRAEAAFTPWRRGRHLVNSSRGVRVTGPPR